MENSENRRSAGRHGNQHVRLRRAQIIASRRLFETNWRPRGLVLHAQPWGRGRFDGSSNVRCIEEIEVSAAIGKIGEVAGRGFPFGGTKGGFDGVEGVKI